MNYKSPLCSCMVCHEPKSAKGIFSHYFAAHTEEGKQHQKESGMLGASLGGQTYKKKIDNVRHEYSLNPSKCAQCDSDLSYEKRNNKFCDNSCAATYNNKNCKPGRKYGPTKVVFTIQDRIMRRAVNRWKLDIVGPYSRLYQRKCAECDTIIIARTSRKFCENHADKYSHVSRAKYWFSFALHDYPDLFDFSLIKQHGMRTNTSTNGVVRDHKVSVADAIKYNYDPYYIKHPLNCELMLNSENARKHKKSSLSYEELVALVDEYDKKKLVASLGFEPRK